MDKKTIKTDASVFEIISESDHFVVAEVKSSSVTISGMAEEMESLMRLGFRYLGTSGSLISGKDRVYLEKISQS